MTRQNLNESDGGVSMSTAAKPPKKKPASEPKGEFLTLPEAAACGFAVDLVREGREE
jgi:hypothetical protein